MAQPTTSPSSARPRHDLGSTILVQIHAIKTVAMGIQSFDLRPAAPGNLPEFSAGSHIEVQLPNGLVRHYSMVNSPFEAHRYVIAVNRDPMSRGGSEYMHGKLKAGDTLKIKAPQNHFPLDTSAASTVLFAGGIGVTPLVSMAEYLTGLGRRWDMHYFSRSAERAAYADRLAQLASQGDGTLRCHFDDSPATKVDFAACVSSSPLDAQVYCCGPTPMLDAFVSACAGRPAANVHLERFAASEVSSTEGGYSVVLSRSGRTIRVEPGETILDALLAHGVDASFSCREGVCGSCETGVISGEPDHRDSVLRPDERKSNRTMMICCSGCRSEELVLDL